MEVTAEVKDRTEVKDTAKLNHTDEVNNTALINVDKYVVDFKNCLGNGMFGIVYAAKNTTSNDNVVSKLIHYNRHPGLVEKAKALYSHLKVNHDNIINIFDCVEKSKDLYIFMEWCKYGDLKRYFKSNKSPNLDIRVAIMLQIAKGLEYLHEINIIHRDMKPANVLVKNIIGDVPNIKLTDFDLSKYIDPNYETSVMTTDVGTMMFKAPEFFRANAKGKREYHRDVDIYATGLIFLALIQEIETGDGELCPKLETAEEAGEAYDPIGGTIGARIRYQSKFSLDVVKIKETEDRTIKAFKGLIKKMTQAEPRGRIPASQVVDEIYAIHKMSRPPKETKSIHPAVCPPAFDGSFLSCEYDQVMRNKRIQESHFCSHDCWCGGSCVETPGTETLGMVIPRRVTIGRAMITPVDLAGRVVAAILSPTIMIPTIIMVAMMTVEVLLGQQSCCHSDFAPCMESPASLSTKN